jgi:D-sedoheptulose 7-phosphate isomerase
MTPASHLYDLVKRLPALAACQNEIEKAYGIMQQCIAAGGKVLLCGNGGSAADADHWSGELLKGFCSKRPLPSEERQLLPSQLADSLQRGISAIPLGAFPAFSSAFANDVAPELTYAQLVWALGRTGDVLVALSTSGNAQNVNYAAKVAKAKGLATIGLTGAGGGKLAQRCDVIIAVPARETYLVQEMHLPVYHCLSRMLEDALFA